MQQQAGDWELLARFYWKRHGRTIILVVVAVAVVLWAVGSSFYTVPATSQGVVLRLGRYARTTEPGFHLKLPSPLETVYRVPIREVKSLEFGFRTIEPGRVTRYAPQTEEFEEVALMLTGDLNLAHVEWIVQYRIKDPRDYLFQIGGDPRAEAAVGDLIRNVSEAVMRQLVGDRSVDEAITINREEIRLQAARDIQQELDRFRAGIEVDAVRLQDVTPPEPVKDAFDAVNRARQNKERAVNEALGERNRQIPAARGEMQKAISEALGYKERVTAEMTGRTKAFLDQLRQYKKAPDVTRARLYLETMEQVLRSVSEKTIIDDSVRGLLPLLELNRPPARKGGQQ